MPAARARTWSSGAGAALVHGLVADTVGELAAELHELAAAGWSLEPASVEALIGDLKGVTAGLEVLAATMERLGGERPPGEAARGLSRML